MKEEKFISKIVKVGERGQVVIPKTIRRIEGIRPNSVVRITNYGTGNIIISKVYETKSPEERFLEVLQSLKMPKNAWEIIQEERHKER
jgi:AbrB family looped-hinge helix DNA binding protein